MFIVSGYLAFRLAKDIERNDKAKRAKIQQKINIHFRKRMGFLN